MGGSGLTVDGCLTLTVLLLDSARQPIASTLGTADAASAALGLTIEEVPTIVVLAEQPLVTPPPNSDEPQCDGGCIGVVAGGCFVLLLVLMCTGWLSGGFAKTAAGASRRHTPRSSRIMPQDERLHSRALVCDTSAII